MKMNYEVIGLQEEGERIRLIIKPLEVKEKVSTTKLLSDPTKFIESMKMDAIRRGRPESITVPKEYWEQYKWNIGSVISVSVDAI